MTSIAIDGQNEEDFRRGIETDLRHGREVAATERLRRLLEPYAAPGGILPERFLSVTADDLALRGWEFLGDCIARHDRPGRPVTAIGIGFAWPGDDVPVPDATGRLTPHLETAYYNDAAYPFSQSGRDDLLDGYSLHGCTWAADCEASDNALSVDGIDDLHGALAGLETQLLDSEEPDEEAIRAGSLGACLLSALLFQAVGRRVASDGLPRPLCVTAGSNGIYPYFDAPVVGMPENVRRAAEKADEEERDTGVPGPRYSSLLMTGIPRAQKRAVLVLAESESEMAVRIASLRGHQHGAEPAHRPPEELAAPAPLAEPVTAAASPLLSKKPSQHNWDFRDLLSAPPAEPLPIRPPERDLAGTAGDKPGSGSGDPDEAWFDAAWDEASGPGGEPPAEPALPSGDEPAPEPDDAPAFTLRPVPKVPRLEQEPCEDVHPGFPMLSESLQDRLESLLAPQEPLLLDQPEIALPVPMPDEPVAAMDAPEPAPIIANPWPIEAAGLAWPYVPWSDEPGNFAPTSAQRNEPDAAPAEPRGLFSRFVAWILRQN
ncbi:hypothetical protein [Novosphingobium sp.]|uniref:hypothetical protein n=1 Tax=Novosphingobium sp. TaxID=1874826 RepID=UPI00286D3729|nr:hypothetical protein [Novosphingobium sp.]